METEIKTFGNNYIPKMVWEANSPKSTIRHNDSIVKSRLNNWTMNVIENLNSNFTINNTIQYSSNSSTTTPTLFRHSIAFKMLIAYVSIIWGLGILAGCAYFIIIPLWFRCSRTQQYGQLFPRSPTEKLPRPRIYLRCNAFKLPNGDGIELGVWHLPPHLFCCRNCNQQRRLPPKQIEPNEIVVLYAHSNAGNRANGQSLFYALNTELVYHIVTFDYRGYGDSTNEQPTATTMVDDIGAVYEWILSHGATPKQVLLWGHSIGTGVVVRLLSTLSKDRTPLGAVLEAAFTTLSEAIADYPPLYLVSMVPWFKCMVTNPINNNVDFCFDSISLLPNVKCPLLILHSRDDSVVPVHHGCRLYKTAKRVQPAEVAMCTMFHMFPPEKEYGHNEIQNDRRLYRIVNRFVNNIKQRMSYNEYQKLYNI